MNERVRYRKWVLTLFCTKSTGFTKRTALKSIKDNFNKYDVLIISPYHDKDIDTEPHYHVILQHHSQIDFNVIKKCINCIHCEPQRSNNLTAYNYLYHNTKDSKDKYQYDKNEIYCNFSNDELLLWLGDNDKKKYDAREVGIDIMSTIESCTSIWEVIKNYPEYWRDVSKIKELWYLYKIHKFQENNGWEPDIESVKSTDNTLLAYNLTAGNKEVPSEEDVKDIF